MVRRGTFVFISAVMAAVVVLSPSTNVMAVGWQPTGLTDDTWSLETPSSGAFFARTLTDTLRSDDAGQGWHSMPLPPALDDREHWGRAFVIDPSNHSRMFVGNWVTHDDGDTWTQLGSWPIKPAERYWLVVSPADPNLLYVAFTSGGMGTGSVRFMRSHDAGDSWETILELGPQHFRPSSVINVTLFEAHPSDPNVMFQSVVGYRAYDNQGVVRRSDDYGTTLKQVLFVPGQIPSHLVGGRGVKPARFYCPLGTDLYLSDDGGIDWTKIGTPDPDRSISNLDYDPSEPDVVYVVLGDSTILRSVDAGETWTDLGLSGHQVHDIALGVDGRNLYAATDHGVLRLPLR